MAALITILFVPIMIINALGGIVSGVWLAILGEWPPIIIGLVMTFGGAFVCALLLLPSLAFGAPGLILHNKGTLARFFSFPFIVFGVLWTFIVMAGWGLAAYYFILKHADASTILPLSIWAYGAAIGPWMYMSSKDENDRSMLQVMTLQLACLVFTILLGFELVHINDAIFTYLAIMLLGSVAATIIAIGLMVTEQRAMRGRV